jgi:hypothetical protein
LKAGKELVHMITPNKSKMKKLKWFHLLFVAVACFSLASCANLKKENKTAETIENETLVTGNYVTAEYFQKDEGYDWVAVTINELTDSLIQVSVRSRADKKRPTCTLDARAVKLKNEGAYQAYVDGNSIIFRIQGDSLEIKEDPDSGYSNLYYFCSGGATLAGVYKKISEPLDQSQIDKVDFRKFLNDGNYSFLVEVYDKTLSIESFGLTVSNEKLSHQLEGSVMNAEVGDLNVDGFPEVFVYVQSDGSGSYGSLIGYSVNNGKSMSQVWLPDILENVEASRGYMGHDEFSIIENTLVRRFPVYNPGDSNASPTGGTRQLQYKLIESEASRQFIIDKIVDY